MHLALFLDDYLLVTVPPLTPSLLILLEFPLELSLQELQTLLILRFEVLLDQIFGLGELRPAVAKSLFGF